MRDFLSQGCWDDIGLPQSVWLRSELVHWGFDSCHFKSSLQRVKGWRSRDSWLPHAIRVEYARYQWAATCIRTLLQEASPAGWGWDLLSESSPLVVWSAERTPLQKTVWIWEPHSIPQRLPAHPQVTCSDLLQKWPTFVNHRSQGASEYPGENPMGHRVPRLITLVKARGSILPDLHSCESQPQRGSLLLRILHGQWNYSFDRSCRPGHQLAWCKIQLLAVFG